MSQFDLGDELVIPMVLDGAGEAEGPNGPGAGCEEEPSGSAPQPPQLDIGLELVVHAGAEDQHGPLDGHGVEVLAVPPRAKYARQSAELMMFARQCKSIKQKDKKIKGLSEQLAQTTGALEMVTNALPGAAAMLGKQGGCVVGRVKKGLSPKHFLVLIRAAFMASKTKCAVGIKHKRLVCAASKLILARQTLALDSALRSCRALVRPSQPEHVAAEKAIHLTYVHMWDETQVRSKARRSDKYRKTGLAIKAETMSQRGAVRMCLMNTGADSADHHDEAWLCKPIQVSGTSAPALITALDQNIPAPFKLGDIAALKALSDSVTSFSFLPISDRASGNVAIMRYFVAQLEKLHDEEGVNNILILPDFCGVHAHHRGKLSLKPVRPHIMRHFSVAHLYRLEPVQSRMIRRVEQLVSESVRRRVAPPPGNVVTLYAAIDILYQLDAPHHKRGADGEGCSQRLADLKALANMVNGDLRAVWTHWCWSDTTSRPCCGSHAECVEKTTTAVVNALFGQADPIPAESRWTSMLANFKQTILRKLVHSAGIACFDLTADVGGSAEEGMVQVDGEAGESFFQFIKQTRIGRVAEYYRDGRTFNELVVISIAMGIYDGRLLYPMLGDPVGRADKQSERRPLNKLLDKEDSAIGHCMEELLGCLQTWNVGGPNRRPWLLLEALGAPVADEEFMRWSRSLLLRLSSSVCRRYELKYASWPYRLHALYSLPDADSTSDLANELLHAEQADLDPYSLGLRRLFSSTESLLSAACRETVRADFDAHGYTTDLVERLHADATHNISLRTGGVNFANLSREALLRQACALHTAGGGQHPLGARKAKGAPPATEEVVLPPLLEQFYKSLQDGVAFAAAGQPALEDAPASSVSSSRFVAAGDSHVGASSALVPLASGTGRRVVSRPCADALVQSSAGSATAEGPRVGLSPKVLELNKQLQAARVLKGRPLTREELAAARADFDVFWKSLACHDSYIEAYNDWRANTIPKAATSLKFQPSWGGGCFCSPISSAEFCHYQASTGWPSDAEVYDNDGTESAASPDTSIRFPDSAGARIWSAGAAARNVPRRLVPSAKQFDVVERGLANVVAGVGKQKADAGELPCVRVVSAGLSRNLEH